MADVMCIVSKAVFEKQAGKHPQLGAQLGMDRYVTANKALAPVAEGGKLYLVTVRPPDESLWLVAVLDNPEFDGEQWIAAPCTTPITDISALRSQIKFESGKGITAAAGALGMSLQTPRVLTAADAALLDAQLPQARAPEAEGFPDAPEDVLASTGERAQGDALVQAVVAEPDSELARQVFADALQARNDPRGEFVVLELALAGPLSIRKRDVMQKRRDELYQEHAAEWFPTQLAFRTRGGFITAVTGSVDKLLAEPATFTSQPIIEVTVTSGDPAKLVKAPWLRRVRRLVLRGELGTKGFSTIVSAPSTQQLTELNVTACGLEPASLGALKSFLPQCRTLVLTANPIKVAGLDTLIAWPHLAQLETLYLSDCGLTAAGVGKLLAQDLPKLDKLTLSNNKLEAAIATVITRNAKHLPQLRYLELVGTRLDKETVTLLGAAKLPAIRRIDVRKNKVSESDVASMPVFRGGIRG
jgi:uncharacterized protein (TIGR02996 family)